MADAPNPTPGANITPQPTPGAQAPAQPTPAGETATPQAEAAPPTRAQRRAAAVAKVIAAEGDKAKPAEPSGIGTSPSAEVKPVEPKEEAKPEQPLSPQMAQLARRDAEVRAGEQKLKAERETFRQEQHAATQGKLTHDQFSSMARTNPVQLAETLKLAPHERRDMAEQLFWSSYTDEERGKLPADYQQRMQSRAAQAKPLTETDALRTEVQKARDELKAFQDAQVAKEKQAEETRVQTNFLDHTVGELGESFPHVSAMLESDPEGTRGVLWQFALSAAKADPEAEVTTAVVAGKYEAFLAERLKPLAKVYGAKPAPVATVPAPKAATGLSEASIATPTPVRTEPVTRAERRANAFAKIDRQG